MAPISIVHTALGVTALATGAIVLARRKGDRLHRAVGRVYVGSMVVLCGLAFGLRDTTPMFSGFGPFHAAALVSLGTVVAGAVSAWRRRPGWLPWHFMWMAWSYIGLVMATGGHLQGPLMVAFAAVGVPEGVAIGLSLFVVWGLPPIVGRRWIARSQPGWFALAPFVDPDAPAPAPTSAREGAAPAR
ncbi:DUF2306 domain-containing protein [Rubrivirga sp. IMCC45206]|uniref:DUF2306 domain-containing protein n=1 Tax=Rubrivirga sp. IMCC45206 TaxID=3391614 RepID=UPI003990164C